MALNADTEHERRSSYKYHALNTSNLGEGFLSSIQFIAYWTHIPLRSLENLIRMLLTESVLSGLQCSHRLADKNQQ
jgi:hypothetical protein